MKVEFIKTDKRRDWGLRDRYLDALYLSGRPDTQSFTLSPDTPLAAQCVAEREVEAVEFNVGMEAL